MSKTTISGAAQKLTSAPRIIAERTIRDDVVPQLARRVRPSKSTWIVYLRSGGKERKKTLGDCEAFSVERARDLARGLLDVEQEPDLLDGHTSSDVPRLQDFAETFLSDCAGRWKASTLKTNRRAVVRLLILAFG